MQLTQSNGPHSYNQHYRAIISLGIPIIIGQVGAIVQGLADTIMMGQYSAQALAAASFVNSLMVLILVIAMGYSYGLTPVVGAFHARGENFQAGQALRSSLYINGRLAIVLTGFMGVLYFLLDRMGQPEHLLPEMRLYYLTILFSLPFQILFNAFKQFSDGVGDTKTPMWILLIANVQNIIGNWFLIYGIGPAPELGILGAGLSTLLSRVLILVLISLVVWRGKRFAPYRKGLFCRDKNAEQKSELHRLGVPIALQMGMEAASFSLCAVMQGWLGEAPLAAHQIMSNIGSLCFLVYYGIGASVAIRISHFQGVNDWGNVRRSALAGCRLIMFTGLLIAGSIVTARHYIGLIFTQDQEVNRIVLTLMLPFVLYQFGDALQTNFANSLRGIADVKPMMRYAFISYIVVSLPLSYILGFTFRGGALGIWMAFPVALTLAGGLYCRRFLQQTGLHIRGVQ